MRSSPTSAHFPGARAPQSSRRRHSAPPDVASRHALRASSAVGPPLALASSNASWSSIAMLPSSLLAEPSTPSPTRAPARITSPPLQPPPPPHMFLHDHSTTPHFLSTTPSPPPSL